MDSDKNRYLFKIIEEMSLLNSKMAFISGPRQVGKTTLSKEIGKSYHRFNYYNWDDLVFRKKWATKRNELIENLTDEKKLIIFDELHKSKLWKRDLKGLYDLKENMVDIIVTGSARLNTFKKGSDSLLGRYFSFRLHPFSLGEIVGNNFELAPEDFLKIFSTGHYSHPEINQDAFNSLLKYGGFPEPLFKKSKKFHQLWQRGRIEKIVREDLRDLSRIQELSQVELLISMLPDRVGSLFSTKAIREDLEIAPLTLKRWLEYLKELYYYFEIKPYSKSIPRSLKKEGKIYLWDWSEIESPGHKLENLVASHLLKLCDFWTDGGEGKFDLYYLRNKEKQEVDFVISKNNKPWISFEVKSGQTQFQKTVLKFSPFTKHKLHIQLCNEKNFFRKFKEGDLEIIIISIESFLSILP